MTHEEAIEKLEYDRKRNKVDGQMDDYWEAFDMAIKALEEQMKIVKCGNCKHYDKTEMFDCCYMNRFIDEDDYCSHGGGNMRIDWSEEE